MAYLRNGAEQSKNQDWRSHNCWRYNVSSSCQLMARALEEKFRTDVCFKIGPDGVLFHAHKIILAIASPVFEAMFYGSLREEGIVVVPDILPGGFQGLLRYIYSGDTNFKSFDEALAVEVAADKYCVSSLIAICDTYGKNAKIRVNSENIWEVLHYTLVKNNEAVKEKCLKILMWNTHYSLACDNFLKASQESVEQVLLLDKVDVPEAILLNKITSWAEANAIPGKSDEMLKLFLPHICFGALPAEEFLSFVEGREGIMSRSDLLSILRHINEPSSCSLPEWCRKKHRINLDII